MRRLQTKDKTSSKVASPVKAAPAAPSVDPASAIYLNADDNVAGFVENLYNEYKIRANIERVIDYIEEKLKKRANRVVAYVAFSKKLLKEKSFKHANNLLSEGLQRHSDSAALMIEMGKLKYVTQIFPEAADAFAAALKAKDVNKLETLYNLGLTCLQMGKNEETIGHLQEVLKLKPDYVNAIATLGVAYKRLGKKEEALKAFNEALKLSPNDCDVINNIGGILYEQEKYDKAAEQFLKALQIKPEDIEMLSNLGNALTKAKNYQHAWVAFDEALKISPANTQIIENYLLCLLDGKYFDKFDEILGKIKFLTADVKNRLQAIADEYKTMLGVKQKQVKRSSALFGSVQQAKKGMKNLLQKVRAGGKASKSVVEPGSKPNIGAKGELPPVMEEAD